jgi:PTS system mannose-specific IID component
VQISLLQAIMIAVAAYLGMSVWGMGVGYFTLYRPLIAGTIVGLVLGNVQQGMAFGAALNAVHLGFVSTGGTLPSDLVTAGYIGTALALASGLDVDAALAAFGIPLGVLGGFLWYARLTIGSVFVHWADARAEHGDTTGVAAVNLWAGQGLLFIMYAVPTFVIVYWGQQGMDQVIALLPAHLLSALSVVGGLLPAVGLGLLLHGVGRARLIPFFLIGFLFSTYLELPLLVIALLGVAVAWLMVGEMSPAVTEEAPGMSTVRRVPRRVLYGAWWRWMMFLHASYNYERLQGLGFAHAMKPVIDTLYHDLQERRAALKRHLVFFNSEPQFGALVPAVVIAMEEERAAGGDLSDETINAVKSGLMGPLAGVGDSLIQGLITPLLLSLGIGLAQQGSLLGPVLYAILISGVIIGTSYTFWTIGYRWGKAAVGRVLASGWVQVISNAAAVTGLTVVGALTATVVQFSLSATVAIGPTTLSLQTDVLDPILRGLLPLVTTLGTWWLYERGVSPLRAIGVLFAVGFGLSYLGLAGTPTPSLFTREWWIYLVGGAPATWKSVLARLWPLVVTLLIVIAVGMINRIQKSGE